MAQCVGVVADEVAHRLIDDRNRPSGLTRFRPNSHQPAESDTSPRPAEFISHPQMASSHPRFWHANALIQTLGRLGGWGFVPNRTRRTIGRSSAGNTATPTPSAGLLSGLHPQTSGGSDGLRSQRCHQRGKGHCRPRRGKGGRHRRRRRTHRQGDIAGGASAIVEDATDIATHAVDKAKRCSPERDDA